MDDRERWFDTPATYSREEAREIKRLVAERRSQASCPRCKASLMFGTPIAQGKTMVWPIVCPECHRSVMIRQPAE